MLGSLEDESWEENLEREYRARRSIGRRSCGSGDRLTSQGLGGAQKADPRHLCQILVSMETAEPQGLKDPVPTQCRVGGRAEGAWEGSFAGTTSVDTLS